VAAGPDHGCAIIRRKMRQRPHDIDLEFYCSFLGSPQIVIAVRRLRFGAGMELMA